MTNEEYAVVATKLLDYLGDQGVWVSGGTEEEITEDSWAVTIDGSLLDIRPAIDVILSAVLPYGPVLEQE